MKKLILFDIDGTLLWPQRSGALALERALIEVFGTPGKLHEVLMAGMTDRAIVRQALANSTISSQQIEAKWDVFVAAMVNHLRVTVTECDIRACPGVPELLDALASRPDVLLGLVTGNLEVTAPIKLRAAGIEPALFRVGGYGSDDGDRTKLPGLAARRAEALTGQRFGGRDMVVVGDTTADIACGRAAGARTVAVATGSTPIEALSSAGPDYLLPDLQDVERALEAILGSPTVMKWQSGGTI